MEPTSPNSSQEEHLVVKKRPLKSSPEQEKIPTIDAVRPRTRRARAPVTPKETLTAESTMTEKKSAVKKSSPEANNECKTGDNERKIKNGIVNHQKEPATEVASPEYSTAQVVINPPKQHSTTAENTSSQPRASHAPNRPNSSNASNSDANENDSSSEQNSSGDSRNKSQDSREDGRDRHQHNRKRRDRKPKRDRFKKEPEEDIEDLVIKLDEEEHTLVRIAQLQRMNAADLTKYAKACGVDMVSGQEKSQLVFRTVKSLSKDPQTLIVGEGVLEVLPDGFGFLRSPVYNYIPSVEDIYVSPAQIRRFELRKGDTLVGTIRTPREKEKYFALHKIESVNKIDPIKSKERILFENLTALYPQERLVMETSKESLSTRVLDLAAPIGKGQRAMIVAPPRSGKTILLQEIANSISKNNPEVILMMLMVGERPEEVTDMSRTINGEVVASTFDEPPERHVQVAEMVIEKARRQVECGRDVVILLDSMTRLARAYNTVQPHSGKILSGGVDANALHKPKRFFGAARNIEDGGSLTIIASALVDTGSRMDEVIFEEFKGTGNMELVLDRRLADRRTWPAIDLVRSGTRKEDLLYHPSELEKMYLFRRAIADLTPFDAMKLLLERLKRVNRNVEFLLSLKD